MKIMAIGDLYGKVPEGLPGKDIDITLLTGDIGKADLIRKFAFKNVERKEKGLPKLKRSLEQEKAMYEEVHHSTIDSLNKLSKIAPVYTLQGNVKIYDGKIIKGIEKKHNFRFKSTLDEIKKNKNIHLTKNVLRNIDGLRIGFLDYFIDVSWVEEFKPKDYDKSLKKARKQSIKAKRVLDRFGYDLDILLCHQPPYGILDKVTWKSAPKNWYGKHAGSKVILEYIKKYKPRYVICGHIHESAGEKNIGNTKVINLGMRNFGIMEVD